MVLPSRPQEACSIVEKAQTLDDIRQVPSVGEQPEGGSLRSTVGTQGHMGGDGLLGMLILVKSH